MFALTAVVMLSALLLYRPRGQDDKPEWHGAD